MLWLSLAVLAIGIVVLLLASTMFAMLFLIPGSALLAGASHAPTAAPPLVGAEVVKCGEAPPLNTEWHRAGVRCRRSLRDSGDAA